MVEPTAEKVAYRAQPSFTCAGVNWGVEHLKVLLQEHGTVYIPNKNGLVHNSRVTEELQDLGAVFVGSVEDIPAGAVAANSMHGLSPLDVRTFMDKRVLLNDLSCPLVENVKQRIIRAIAEAERLDKWAVILYWCKDVNHPEPKAILELAPSHVMPVTSRQTLEDYKVQPDEMYFADSQTTLNVQQGMSLIREFRDKFPGLKGLPKIGVCFATDNRQRALQGLIEAGIEKLVVIGSPSSSNTTELVKIGKSHGLPVEFMERAILMGREMFEGFNRVGVHGGASVLPDEGDRAMEIFRSWGYKTVDLVAGKPEPRTFPKITPPVYDFRSRSSQISTELLLALTRTY